jgi:Peptidase family M41
VKRLLDEAYTSARRTLDENRDLLEQIAEALLERETLDREEVELLAAGQKLPEAKQVARAREFAESLRREIGGSGETGDEKGRLAVGEGKHGDVEVPISSNREADATS